MSISNEAVEAAMEHFPPIYRSIVVAALGSASPYLFAEAKAAAWDEGWRDGYATQSTKFSLNPYRRHS